MITLVFSPGNRAAGIRDDGMWGKFRTEYREKTMCIFTVCGELEAGEDFQEFLCSVPFYCCKQ